MIKTKKYIEHQIQIGIVRFIRTYYKDKVHIIGSDGTSKSAAEGNKKNKLGYEKGNPDLIILSKISPLPPLFIELKRPKSEGYTPGRESVFQKNKREEFTKVGYIWLVMDDIEKGINAIKEYFNL